MKLMTKELEKKFKQFPLYSQDGKGMDSIVVCKFFAPVGAATWLITEGEKQENGDWQFYGYCFINTWEWGYVLLSELQEVRLPFGLGIERDLYIGEHAKVGELIK